MVCGPGPPNLRSCNHILMINGPMRHLQCELCHQFIECTPCFLAALSFGTRAIFRAPLSDEELVVHTQSLYIAVLSSLYITLKIFSKYKYYHEHTIAQLCYFAMKLTFFFQGPFCVPYVHRKHKTWFFLT